jgi:Protein of unknown function (DUF2971)
VTERTFRRYTNLASVIHLLCTRHITLLNPANWDDRNDAHFMAEYKRQRGAASLLALCFAEQIETYHHWRVFAPGADGVCVEFDKPRLTEMFSRDLRIKQKSVEYVELAQIERMRTVDLERLPFMKRYPYGHEEEYRVVFTDLVSDHKTVEYEIELNWIDHITLSPWMSPAFVDSVRKTLKAIPACQNIRMHQSTLISNDDWKALTSRVRLSHS